MSRTLLWTTSITGAVSMVLAGTATNVAAQQADAGQITLIVGFGAGGSADSIARVVGNKLGDKLGRKIVIENRPGAGGNVAARGVIAAPADGSVLLVTTAALPINETLMKNKGFSVDALRAVSIAASTPETLAVNKANSAKTLAEFVTGSKGKKVNFSSAGVGTGSHIFGEFFLKTILKVDASHVPFKSGPDATNALMGGHVDAMVSSLSGFAGQVNSGDIRALAIATEKRFPTAPSVPTFAEAGYPGHVFASWAGFFAPAKTPNDVVARLAKGVAEALKDKDVDERLRKIGFAPMSGELAEAEAFFKSEIASWGKMVRTLGMSVE